MNILHIWQKILNLPLLYWRYYAWRLHPRRFLSNIENYTIDRPIFLLGVQGGGLTLLARMLRRHPRVVSVTGNHKYWAGPDEMQNVMGDALPAALTGLHSKIPPHPDYPFRDGIYAIDQLLPLYRETADTASPQMRRQFAALIRLAVAVHAPSSTTPRFIDKSQTYTVRLGMLNALLDKYAPHFILVTRNPYASCYRGATRVKSLQCLNISLKERLQLAGQHWSNSFNCALSDATQVSNFLTISFEKLLHRPEETLHQICSFADLSFQEKMLPSPNDTFPLGSTGSVTGDNKWHPIRTNVNQKYLNKLEPWMIDTLHPYVKTLAEKWNYTPEGP